MSRRANDFDVAVVGAGPVGSLTALAHAQRGAKVVMLEANPRAARRLAGEWLHPPALETLRTLGINPSTSLSTSSASDGFVVFSEDGGEPMRLPYARDQRGLSCHHTVLVEALRECAVGCADVHYVPNAKVRAVEGQELAYTLRGRSHRLSAARIVGADGRTSIVRAALGLPTNHVICSRMVGLLLEGAQLPYEGYGHVYIGGPGPLLAYRIDADTVRVIIDLPLAHWDLRERMSALWEGYWPVLPRTLRSAFRAALLNGKWHGAANQVRPRTGYGRGALVLAGDAAGHYHPMTAVGLTLGFADAHCLANCDTVAEYAARRARASRVPELLAITFYEAVADRSDEAIALRKAIYRRWRRNPRVRRRTMCYLACQDTRLTHFTTTFTATAAHAFAGILVDAARNRQWRFQLRIATSLGRRLKSLLLGFGNLHASRRVTDAAAFDDTQTRRGLADALRLSMPEAKVYPARAPTCGRRQPADFGPACTRAVASLLRKQSDAGNWEGEVVWCPVLAAQYVITCHATNHVIPAARRERLLAHFRQTRLEDGLWGLHPLSGPYLFVTTLVYVAARILGIAAGDPLLERAAAFIADGEGVAAIPSWGKLWLALLGLYEWHGVNPVLPEIWLLPRWLAIHPSKLYCHTRLIYMAMAVVYAAPPSVKRSPLIDALRGELFPSGYDRVNFTKARTQLRAKEIYTPPGPWLRLLQAASVVLDRIHVKRIRHRALDVLRARIRFELRSTNHASISPVSGLLNIIALWTANRDDADAHRALAQLEGWIWEDATEGARLTGARSTAWDTAFAVHALSAASPHCAAAASIARGMDFLAAQQLQASGQRFDTHYRSSPKGGWCFAPAWHGWPVSDCTAEALSALLNAPNAAPGEDMVRDAVAFILSCQNRDGGFGSYERRRTLLSLEWMNPAEMFGNSMTERSFIECTASCIVALSQAYERIHAPAAKEALVRAEHWLRKQQRPDGSFAGAWGVNFIYGTMFGIRGLVAAGGALTDPALRKACAWLLERQRPDGGWGEHHAGCLSGVYVAHHESHVVQTAWALSALLEAHEPNFGAIERGARFLADAQDRDGEWPRQRMVGVFFNTALLDYALYRHYFPLHALALYETRRKQRLTWERTRHHPSLTAVGGAVG